MLSAEQVQKFRQLTPGVKDTIHFNNAGSALMPSSVINAIKEHIDLEGKIGGYEAYAAKKDQIASFYTWTAKLINAAPRNVAFTSSATDAYARALSSIPFDSGDIILTSTNDYASNFISFITYKERFGLEIMLLENTAYGEIDLADVRRKLKKYQPKVLAVTHIPTNSGLVQPIEEIGQIVQPYDTIYLVDGCQSVGQLAVDVERIQCEFFSATFRKFLRGPRGAGFLYVSDRILSDRFTPLSLDMLGADWVATESIQLAEDARRYEEWEKPYALVLGAIESAKLIDKIGISSIASRTQKLAKLLRTGLQTIAPIKLLDRGAHQAALITFNYDDCDPAAIKQYLSQHQINCSISALSSAYLDYQEKGVTGAVRLSPHYYNTEDEVHQVIQALHDLIA